MLRLPDTPAFDARSRVKAVDDAPAEEVSGGRRVAPIGGYGLSGFAEQQSEPGTGRDEARRRRQRQIELESVWQQEHAVNRRPAHKVDELHRGQLVAERASPVIENFSNGHVVGDGEGEVKVREAIAAAEGQRADSGSSNDPSVLLGKGQHAFA